MDTNTFNNRFTGLVGEGSGKLQNQPSLHGWKDLWPETHTKHRYPIVGLQSSFYLIKIGHSCKEIGGHARAGKSSIVHHQ